MTVVWGLAAAVREESGDVRKGYRAENIPWPLQ